MSSEDGGAKIDEAGSVGSAVAARSRWVGLVGCLAAVVGTAVAARLDLEVPGTSVPQSAQTLAVVLGAALLGSRWGVTAMGLYLLAGALGLPVFAGGEGGASHLLGPTAGYLVGFVTAAALVGRWVEADLARGFGGAVVGMLSAHAAILLLGGARLAIDLGVAPAYRLGVEPFLLGAVLKSIVAGSVVAAVSRWRAAPADGGGTPP